MANVIDLAAARNDRAAPDPEFVKKDDYGRPMFQFLLDYQFEDGTWSINLWAYSWEDAEARVAAMRQSLRVEGQLHSSIPA